MQKKDFDKFTQATEEQGGYTFLALAGVLNALVQELSTNAKEQIKIEFLEPCDEAQVHSEILFRLSSSKQIIRIMKMPVGAIPVMQMVAEMLTHIDSSDDDSWTLHEELN